MKRVVVILMLLIIVLLGILYFGISSQQSFARAVSVGCTNDGALRVLVNEQNKKQGWPGEKLTDSTYRFEQLQYTVGNTFMNVTRLHFENSAIADLIIEEKTADSSRFIINYSQQLPLNPLSRIRNYLKIQEAKNKMDAFLAAMKKNFHGEELVYGIKIHINRVIDSTMIATRTLMNHYPGMSEVYTMIDDIRTYIRSNGGEETSNPMLNVFEEGENQYLVMVAVPTKTFVKGNETFLIKRMLANGFILVSDVTGGNYTIKQAETSMKQYVLDHHKSSPAIPFQMLLTDRRAEPDTSKWKTRLYYPVMY